ARRHASELAPARVVAPAMPRTLTFAALVLAACGGATPRRPAAVPRQDEVIAMEEMRIVASREDGDLVFDSYDAGQLFERGTALLNEGRCREAVERHYDRLAREFPTSRYLAPALYNAGLC